MSREAAASLGIPVPPRILGPIVPQDDEPRSQVAAERGLLAHRRGDEFEESLNITHVYYMALGIASIRKLPVETGPAPKRVRDPERKISPGAIRVLAKRQGFDYMGTLAGGRSIVMEAKATGTEKCSIRIADHDGVRVHQLRSLAAEISIYNAVGCIVWNNGGRRLVLPPAAVVKAWERYQAGGRKSIPADEFLEYQLTDKGEQYLAALQENME